MTDPWRDPAVESVDLYPGLVVHDGRVSGSITCGPSRLPLWAFVGWIPTNGWDEVYSAFEPENYGWTAEKMGGFLRNLMQCRGEFARLLLVLADAERLERADRPWWQTKRHRKRVRDQLLLCLEKLEGDFTYQPQPEPVMLVPAAEAGECFVCQRPFPDEAAVVNLNGRLICEPCAEEAL